LAELETNRNRWELPLVVLAALKQSWRANQIGDGRMSLRRCPSCSNTVERDSDICPICGRNYTNALVGKIIRWVVVLALVVWIGHHFYAGRH
jgi:uncharacterized OB-fold protein